MDGVRRCPVLFCMVVLLVACGEGGEAEVDSTTAPTVADIGVTESETSPAVADIEVTESEAGAESEDVATAPLEELSPTAAEGGTERKLSIAYESPCAAISRSQVEAVLQRPPARVLKLRPGDLYPKVDLRRKLPREKVRGYVCMWSANDRSVALGLEKVDQGDFKAVREFQKAEAERDSFAECEVEDGLAAPGSFVRECESDKFDRSFAEELVPLPPGHALHCKAVKSGRRDSAMKDAMMTFCSAVVDVLEK